MSKRNTKLPGLLLCAALLCALAPQTARADVVLSDQHLAVNGETAVCEAYNIDGSNYFKLRDLAYLLGGTGSRFSVDYDGEKDAVVIRTGSSYEANGTELDVSGGDRSGTAVAGSQTLIVDGTERGGIPAYNIGGSNYFRLRDLGELLGFGVRFSAADDTARVYSLDTDRARAFARLKEMVVDRGNGLFDGAESLLTEEELEGRTLQYHIAYDKSREALCFSAVLPWEEGEDTGSLTATVGVFVDTEETETGFALRFDGREQPFLTGSARLLPGQYRPGADIVFAEYGGLVPQPRAERAARTLLLLALQSAALNLRDTGLSGDRDIITDVFGFSEIFRV